ncbi:phosphoglycerate kinase [Vulcanisaeta distributa]|uniref:Phosphoglycerate kinase n=1 Tax=Vulcanisaeta distributa (strain DSM 14429 / JCM 11212 / NBRC 100878 / IC-017) TaxID=572478 RepID=E1QNY5_VULDI|nr:phosphoglycerate kinase [Vulcanisaeta distributa]ADN51350.1 Phosphoglycerate kinase [Vulcanisaeta distributa DSM 14429]
MGLPSLPSSLPTINLCSKGRVLVRVDMNVPINRDSGEILDEYRIEAHSKTIKYLVDLGLPVVVVTHQGRPGDPEFVSLETHVKVLSKYLGMDVHFIDDVIGPRAREEIGRLRPGEVLMLDNLRFISEEVIEGEPQKLANTYLVRKLAPLFNYFILDAFATAHRSQPSIVGFPYVLPSCMGLIMEREVNALSKVLNTRGVSTVLIAGGAKVPETVKAIKALLTKNLVNKVLVGGLVSQLFLALKHGNNKLLSNVKVDQSTVNDVMDIMKLFSDKIVLPVDAVQSDGKVIEPSNAQSMLDIGPETIELFNKHLITADIAIMTGPLGLVEVNQFAVGTREVMKAMVYNAQFTVIGGGHTIMSARKFGLIDRISHVSTGGRAFIQFLADPYLPGIKALELSKSRFWV